MNIKNSKNWLSFSKPQAYGGAFVLTVAAFFLRSALQPFLEPYLPFQVFVLSCLLTEYLFGLMPALMALVISFFLGMTYFIAPYGELGGGISRFDFVASTNFLITTGFSIFLIEYLKRALYSNQMLLKVSRSRYKISLYRENDRLYFSRRSDQTRHDVERLFSSFDQVLLIRLNEGQIFPQQLFFQTCGVLPTAAQDWITAVHPEDRHALTEALSFSHERRETPRASTIRLLNPAGEWHAAAVRVEGLNFGHVKASTLKLVAPLAAAADR